MIRICFLLHLLIENLLLVLVFLNFIVFCVCICVCFRQLQLNKKSEQLLEQYRYEIQDLKLKHRKLRYCLIVQWLVFCEKPLAVVTHLETRVSAGWDLKTSFINW